MGNKTNSDLAEARRSVAEKLPSYLPLKLYKHTKDFGGRRFESSSKNRKDKKKLTDRDIYDQYIRDSKVEAHHLFVPMDEFKKSNVYRKCKEFILSQNKIDNDPSDFDVLQFWYDHIEARISSRRLHSARYSHFKRERIDQNAVKSKKSEPLLLEQPTVPAEKGAVQLKDIPDELLAAEVARREQARPEFVTALTAARTTRDAFNKVAPPLAEALIAARDIETGAPEAMIQPARPGDRSAQFRDASADGSVTSEPVPEVARETWKGRDKKKYKNPADFIARVYARCFNNLARHDLKRLDRPLYDAYTQWILPHRHPGDVIQFVQEYQAPKLDDAEAGRRHRASTRSSKARMRERLRCGGMPQPSDI